MMVDFKRFWELSTGVPPTPLTRGEKKKASLLIREIHRPLPSNKRGRGCVFNYERNCGKIICG